MMHKIKQHFYPLIDVIIAGTILNLNRKKKMQKVEMKKRNNQFKLKLITLSFIIITNHQVNVDEFNLLDDLHKIIISLHPANGW